MTRFLKFVVVWFVFVTLISLVYSRETSKSDRISQIVEGRLNKNKVRKGTKVRADVGEQSLTPAPKNKITKVIDSYAQQRAKAIKLRSNFKSEKKGIRRIG